MTTNPRWYVARHETTTTIIMDDPPSLEPFNAGTTSRPVPTQATIVSVRTRDGVPHTVTADGRRVLARDKGGRASGAHHTQTWAIQHNEIRPAWGEVPPPQWIVDLYKEWAVDGINGQGRQVRQW